MTVSRRTKAELVKENGVLRERIAELEGALADSAGSPGAEHGRTQSGALRGPGASDAADGSVPDGDLLRRVLSRSPIGIALYDADGRLIHVNKACLDVFGIPGQEEIMGYGLFDDPRFSARAATVLRRGQPVRYGLVFDFDRAKREHVFSTSRSGVAHVDVFIISLGPADGSPPVGYLMQIRDVTDQKLASDALKASESKYRGLFSSVSDAAIVFDAKDHRITDANDAACTLFGYEPDQFRGLVYSELLGDPKLSGDVSDEVLEGRASHRSLRYCRRKDGSPFPAEVAVSSFTVAGSMMLCAVFRDISEQTEHEHAIELERAQLLSVFNAMDEPVYVADPHTYEVLYVNDHLRTLLGYDPVGGRCYEHFQGLDHPCPFCTNEIILNNGGQPHQWEFHNPLLDRDYIITDRIIRWPDGSDVRFEMAIDVTSRRDAEQALRESQERMALVLHGSGLGTWDWDMPTGRLTLNERWAEMLGYRVDELELHVSMWERLVHRDDLPGVNQALQAHLDGREPSYESVYRMRSKSGTWRWILDMGKVLTRDAEGRPLRACGTHLDLTEPKEAQDALAQHERLLSTVINTDPNCIFVKDQKSRYVLINRAIVELYGASAADMKGRTDLDFAHMGHLSEEEALHFQEDDRRAAEGQTAVFIPEEHVTLPDGTVRWFQTTKVPLELEGQPGYMLGVGVDITARKETEEALRESQEKVRGIVDNVGLGIAVISPQMEVLELNRKMREWFPDVDPAQRPRCYSSYHCPGRDGPCDGCPTLLTLADGQVHENVIVTTRRDASVVFRVISSPLRDAEGEVIAAIEMVEDFTDRIELEEQLRQSAKLESIGRLAGGIAHDFNNILTGVIGYTQLLIEDTPRKSPARHDLEQIDELAHRAAGLTQQLLAFSRRQAIEPVVTNINALIEDTVTMLRRIIGEDVAVRLELEPSLGSSRVDPTLMQQVLMNLAVNSRDAMPHGGSLTIETDNVNLDSEQAEKQMDVKPGNYVMLAVIDTGTGMDEETLQHIFEPFFTTKGVGEGTGLGLATVYGIVRQHGGSIRVQSVPAEGTTVRIFLPRAGTSPQSVTEPRPSTQALGGTETILLVEDEPAVRSLAERVLEEAGYTVLVADAPDAAERLFEEHREDIDLLLTDVVLPGRSGRQLYEDLSRRTPGLLVLYMSGYTDDAIIRHGVLEEGTPFMQKPFTPAELHARLREALASGGHDESP